MRLLDRTACWTICDIRTREFERPPAVIAAAGVELSGMVREGEQMSPKKLIETKPCGVELCLGLFEPLLHDQHVGKTPPDLRIAAPARRRTTRATAGPSSQRNGLGPVWSASVFASP